MRVDIEDAVRGMSVVLDAAGLVKFIREVRTALETGPVKHPTLLNGIEELLAQIAHTYVLTQNDLERKRALASLRTAQAGPVMPPSVSAQDEPMPDRKQKRKRKKDTPAPACKRRKYSYE